MALLLLNTDLHTDVSTCMYIEEWHICTHVYLLAAFFFFFFTNMSGTVFFQHGSTKMSFAQFATNLEGIGVRLPKDRLRVSAHIHGTVHVVL